MTALDELFAARVTGEVDVLCSASPAQTGWRYLTYATLAAKASATITLSTGPSEIALVPLNGAIDVTVDGQIHALSRRDVFLDTGSVVYAPPGTTLRIDVRSDATFAIGGAPADPAYAARYIAPSDVRVEMRGGGAAHRQVGHLLSPPLEAHRLILYEVHVPRGAWSGWPPHCHDGYLGSPYLEETYYFELQPTNGFAFHRNFREVDGLDDTFVAKHQSLVTVPSGFHTTAACPGSHMYFLNFLAGDIEHGDRRLPPCFDDRYTWIDGHWDDDPLTYPQPGLK
jgi:5-deoxy-glucuronate isomerase